MQKKIPYGRHEVTAEDLEVVQSALLSDFLTQGPEVGKFETAFAEYVGSKYAVAVSNGTAALHLCAIALGVNENTKVITSPITFTASANCVRFCGGEVYFADIDPNTILLDPKAVRKILEAHPPGTFHGIIPVEFAGYAVDLEAFRKLADEFGLWIIEDACHAPGGNFTDSKGKVNNCGNGAYADLAIFSFHPVKHIACGEGGMITTNDEALYKKLLRLRTHGITKDPEVMEKNDGGWYYEMHTLGYNYRLTDFQGALGRSQLKKADKNIARRRFIAKKYDEALVNIPGFQTVAPPTNGQHAYHLYVVLCERRKEFYDYLRSNGILAQIHYIPVHTQPYYRDRTPADCPNAEDYYSKCISLPMFPSLKDEEQDYVIEKVKAFFQ